MTPEQEARKRIDRQPEHCGWLVQDHAAMNVFAGRGVAVREFPLRTGFADYVLYADGKAIGIIEATPEYYTLTGTQIQPAKYTTGLPDGLRRHPTKPPRCPSSPRCAQRLLLDRPFPGSLLAMSDPPFRPQDRRSRSPFRWSAQACSVAIRSSRRGAMMRARPMDATYSL